MFSSKNLNTEQVEAIKLWASEGANLSDIQRRIREEFSYPLTYMDTRFLILDLQIELIEEKKEEPIAEIKPAPVPTGQVTLTLDEIAVPGTAVSGKVEFSDGEKASWGIDTTGRPSLDPDTVGYQPSQEDIMEFQKHLRLLLSREP